LIIRAARNWRKLNDLKALYCADLIFFFNDTATTEIYTLSLHDALPICLIPLLSVSCSKQLNAVASAPDVPTVAVAKVTSEDLSHSLVLTAEFKPFQEIDVMAKVAGYIKEIKFDVGDRVRQGQLLATLEVPEMGDDLRRAD